MHYIYLILIVITLSYPLFKSFENKIQFYHSWKFLLPSIIISAIIFITWDLWFTHIGIWQFNPDYILGFYILNLPIEEWLFFIVVPFSCIFIYEVMNYYIKKDLLARSCKHITNLLAITLLLIGIAYNHCLHTFITFLSLSIFLFFHQYILRSAYLGRYYISWIVCMIPFLIINGVLTAMPVLIYNESEIIGIRIYTIPVEDVFYGMLLYLSVLTIYEGLKQNRDFKKNSFRQ